MELPYEFYAARSPMGVDLRPFLGTSGGSSVIMRGPRSPGSAATWADHASLTEARARQATADHQGEKQLLDKLQRTAMRRSASAGRIRPQKKSSLGSPVDNRIPKQCPTCGHSWLDK